MIKPITLKVIRGTSLTSGEYFSVNESVPNNITYAQLLAGIDLGTYTLKSLANKSYKGQVRDRANASLKAELIFTVANDRMKFSIPASVTKDWPNEAVTYFYDVFETDTVTGNIKAVAHGNIQVQPAITLTTE